MKIFISWSGQRERAVAEALRDALVNLCAVEVEIFVSSRSISKGANGVAVIEAELDASAFGVVLVSKDNQKAPWLNYEGGWLASTLERPVATVCLDLPPSDITGPLAPRQATRFDDAEDMARLLREIVQAVNPAMNDQTFATLLAAAWPAIESSWMPASGQVDDAPSRDERDMLAELVDRVRRIEELGLSTQVDLQERFEVNARTAAASAAWERDALWESRDASLAFERAVQDLVARMAPGLMQVVLAKIDKHGKRVLLTVSPNASNELRELVNGALTSLPPRGMKTAVDFYTEVGSDLVVKDGPPQN